MARKPEARVKTWLKRVLHKLWPDHWYFMPVQSGRGKHGIPDYIGCIPLVIQERHVGMRIGVFVAIETKAEGNFATPLQVEQISQIRKAGGCAAVLTGTGEEAEQMIQDLYKLLRRN